MNIIERLQVVYRPDEDEWADIRREISGNIPPIAWYGGARLDFKPLIRAIEHQYPRELDTLLPPNLFPVFTDYSLYVLDHLKEAYENLDVRPVFLRAGFGTPDIHSVFQAGGVEILQMIPLRLFSANDLRSIRRTYTRFNASVTNAVIPDDDWHAVYMSCRYREVETDLMYFIIENLVFWKEIVEKFDLNVALFCGLRLGGKSGSWDFTHDPEGHLFSAVRASGHAKPRIWIADECYKLRDIWREIEPHDDGFYGVMHFFETDWEK